MEKNIFPASGSALLSKICPQEKLFNQNLTCWGFVKSLTDLGEENNQLQLTLAFHVGKGKYPTLPPL